MWAAVKLCVVDCVADGVWLTVHSCRYANFERVPWNFAIAGADSHLLAGDRLGRLAAADLRPELVGDVRVAATISRGPLPHLRSFAANDHDLHAGRIGLSRFVR